MKSKMSAGKTLDFADICWMCTEYLSFEKLCIQCWDIAKKKGWIKRFVSSLKNDPSPLWLDNLQSSSQVLLKKMEDRIRAYTTPNTSASIPTNDVRALHQKELLHYVSYFISFLYNSELYVLNTILEINCLGQYQFWNWLNQFISSWAWIASFAGFD